MLLFPDRFWWLQRAWGVLGVLASLACTAWLVVQVAGVHKSFNLGTGWQFIIILLVIVDISVVSFTLGFIPILIGFALSIGIWRRASPARDRFHRRLLAIQGDQDAIPPAEIKIDAAGAPDLSSEPIELLWRATPSNRRIMTTFIAIIILIFGPFAGLCLYLAYCVATNTVPIGSTGLEPISPLERVGWLAVLLVVAAMFLFLVVFVIRWLPWERGRPYGITASSDGLWYYPRGGKKRFLRWEDVRLLEMSKKSCQEYKLYSCKTLAQWTELPPSSLVTKDMTKQEFEDRHQALLNLIAARTHLLPRTFDKKLAGD